MIPIRNISAENAIRLAIASYPGAVCRDLRPQADHYLAAVILRGSSEPRAIRIKNSREVRQAIKDLDQ